MSIPDAAPAALASGIDLADLDPGVRLQDDLFRHANGRWAERTEIPADRSRYGAFDRLHEEAQSAVRAILEGAPDDDLGGAEGAADLAKARALYRAFLDEERVEGLGSAPIAPALAAVEGILDVPALVRAIGRSAAGLGPTLIQPFVDADPGDPSRSLLFFEQAGLGLPDEAYYRAEQHAPIREAYRAHLGRMLALLGLDRPEARADAVLELETAIAATHRDAVSARDAVAAYTLLPWAEAAASWTGEARLDHWLAGFAPAGIAEVVVRQPEFLAGVGALLTPDRLPVWRDWFRWHLLRSAAPYLSADVAEAHFDFYGRTLSGTPQQRERWKRGVALVESLLGEAVGREYVARHFPLAAKAACDALVERLIEAYRASLAELDWLGEATRAQALAKLHRFTPKIGYPVRWRDYGALSVDETELLGSIEAATAFEVARSLAKLEAPVDRDEWFMTPQTVNAYYNPTFNEIVFPAAILQPPFFDPGREPAANYGAIGAVIGHELSHGFDDQGSRYDGEGRLSDWWTPEDRAAFDARAARLIEQYSALSPAQTPGRQVNGALTVGENIADISGLSMAWKAYLLSLGGAEPPVVDGLTGGQRFVLAWAAAWRQKARDPEVERLLAIDPHAPAEFRCNQVVKNVTALYDAITLKAGDALWMNPSERVSLW